LNKTKTL